VMACGARGSLDGIQDRSIGSRPSFVSILYNRLSPLKDDTARGQYGATLCFCITTKDTTASGVVLRAQQAISSWQEDMSHEVHDLAAMRPQTMCDSTLQAEAGTHANVCPPSSSPGEGRKWPTP
jgi:hypothetical protein